MIDIRIELLKMVIQYDGTEYGEMLESLLHLERKSDYYSDDLRIAVDKEIQMQYEWCRDNLVFEETEEIITRKVVWIRSKEDDE
jgi:hypothetical protein